MGEYLIPKVTSTIPRAVVEAEHPEYKAQLRTLRFGRENYDGSGGYAPYLEDVKVADTQPDDEQGGTMQIDTSRRTHLFRHPREKKKFERRYIQAYLTNVIKKAVNMIAGFLTKKQPTYDDYPETIKRWMSSVNAQGDTWEQFKSHDIVPPVLYYGWLPTIFYRRPTNAVTAAQQQQQGGGLVCEVICPENIIHWSASDAGFEWLKVKTEVDKTGPLDEKPVKCDRYTWYTQDGWWYVDVYDKTTTDIPVVESGTWTNGLPVEVWSLRGGAITSDANAVQREAFNINSLIQEQERNTTFSMLSAPRDGGGKGDRVQTVGVDNIFYFPADARHRPDWMAPPPQVLAHLMQKRAELAEEILSTMGLDFDSGSGATGVAFQFKMSKIVRLLQVTADSFSRAESRCLMRVAKEEREKLEDRVRCVWPSEFDAKDVEKEMDALERVITNVRSAAANVEAQVKIAQAGLGDTDEALRSTIRRQVTAATEQDDYDNDNDPDDLRDRADAAKARLGEGGEEDMDDLAADGGAR